MMYRSSVVLLGFLVASLAAAGCDNGPETPTIPTTPTVTETFNGTVNLNGSVTHSFAANNAGNVTATITSMNPQAAVLGFQLGTWDTVRCTAIVSNDFAALNSVLSGTTQSSASLCVKVHDPNGALSDSPVAYTVTVSHH
jgi:hypothetical protein